MPLNSRDLWLVLKAQDQTNRALNTFSRNVRNAGNQVRMAQLEASRASSLGAISQAKLTNELSRAQIGQLQYQKALVASRYVQAQINGATPATLAGIKAQAGAIDHQILGLRGQVAATNSVIASERVKLQATNDSIAQLNAYNRSVQDNEKNLAHLSGRIQSVAQTATAAGFAFAAAGAVTLIALKKSIDVAVEYERQVRSTATQISNFSGNLDELANIGREVARTIAVPFQEIQPALFDIFSSMDVGIADATKLLKEFSKAAVAGQTDISSVSRATIGILNAFGLSASDVNKILDLQFTLVQKGIGTYEEWNQRIGLVTPSAVRAGQSIETMVAALAASTRMGLSAARSGTAVARAFDALSNPAAVKALKELGVSALDAQGKFRPFNEVLRDFRDVLMKMPEKDRLKTILDVFKGAGGTIEARRFLQNILLGKDNLELFDQILADTKNSAGAMEKAYTTMADSAAAKTQLLKNQWMLLQESVGKALMPAFIKVITVVTDLIDKFNELDPNIQRTIAFIALGAGVFLAMIGPLLLVVGAVAAFAAALAVAGTAIAVTLAVMGAAIVAIVAFGTAFVVLYKRSEGFRQIMGKVADTVQQLWGIAKGFAKDVGDAWEKYLAPPLTKLWNVIEEKVLPALSEWHSFVSSRMMPAIREAARIIGDMLGKAFEFIGMIIERFVIPAIKAMTEWWNEHKKTLMPLISAFAQIAKYALILAAIITGILAAAFIGPIVAAIAAVVAAFAALVVGITYTIEIIQGLWGYLKTFFGWLNDFGNWINSGFTAFFTGFWEFLQDLWNHGGEAIKLIWTGIWNSILNLANTIGSAIEGVWNRIWGTVTSVASGVKNAVVSAWNAVVSATISVWNSVRAAISEKISAARDAVSNGINTIKNFFSNAGSWLINAGREIIQGLINGITQKAGALLDKVSWLAGKVKAAWPFSPAKWGPLSGRGDLKYAGAKLAARLAEGMMSNTNKVMKATEALAGQVGYTTADNAYTGVYGQSEPKTVNQNITVNTQEIDPRRHSAELGWELARVM